MHELPAVEDMIETLDRESLKRNIKKIEEIHLTIGELSSYVGECIELYFDLLSAGHTCEGAKLFFAHTRARLKCVSCGLEFDHVRDFTCPSCSGQGRLIKGTGEEFLISSIKYPDPE